MGPPGGHVMPTGFNNPNVTKPRDEVVADLDALEALVSADHIARHLASLGVRGRYRCAWDGPLARYITRYAGAYVGVLSDRVVSIGCDDTLLGGPAYRLGPKLNALADRFDEGDFPDLLDGE